MYTISVIYKRSSTSPRLTFADESAKQSPAEVSRQNSVARSVTEAENITTEVVNPENHDDEKTRQTTAAVTSVTADEKARQITTDSNGAIITGSSTAKQLTTAHRRTVSDSALDELTNNLEHDQTGMGCILS